MAKPAVGFLFPTFAKPPGVGRNAIMISFILCKFEMMNYQQYIEIRTDKRFGQPCIANTRISVSDILAWLASGMTKSEIIEDYPSLKEEHIVAALLFAAEKEHSFRIAS